MYVDWKMTSIHKISMPERQGCANILVFPGRIPKEQGRIFKIELPLKGECYWIQFSKSIINEAYVGAYMGLCTSLSLVQINFVACSVPNHYLNKYKLFLNWNPRNKNKLNLVKKTSSFIH